MTNFKSQYGEWAGRVGRGLAVLVVVVVAGGAAAWFASASSRPGVPAVAEKKDAEASAKLRRVGTDEVIVPPQVQTSLGLKTAAATAPTLARKLPAFQGTLNFDSGRLARVQSPFAGQVTEVGQVTKPLPSGLPSAAPGQRPLKVGDKVNKGDVLAVVWSADLGAKKSEFVDAVSKLKTDEETLERLETLYQNNGTAERTVREAERTVKADRVAVERAEATLRAWRVTVAEIAALRKEADRLATPDAKRTDPAKWARVEITAPMSGVILEKNVAVGQVTDTATDLFRVGDLSKLAVWAHVYEEDLPLLRGVKLPTVWTVSATAVPGSVHRGRMDRIAAAIDPVQHTALVTGTVENANGELRAGMSVSVTVELPPATGEVEVPAEAVIEDGRDSFVFVRLTASGDTFVRRPVRVIRRSRDVIAVAETPDGVKPGDLVVTAGSLLLGDAFGDLPQPKP